jgi:hypothetical protein
MSACLSLQNMTKMVHAAEIGRIISFLPTQSIVNITKGNYFYYPLYKPMNEKAEKATTELNEIMKCFKSYFMGYGRRFLIDEKIIRALELVIEGADNSIEFKQKSSCGTHLYIFNPLSVAIYYIGINILTINQTHYKRMIELIAKIVKLGLYDLNCQYFAGCNAISYLEFIRENRISRILKKEGLVSNKKFYIDYTIDYRKWN